MGFIQDWCNPWFSDWRQHGSLHWILRDKFHWASLLDLVQGGNLQKIKDSTLTCSGDLPQERRQLSKGEKGGAGLERTKISIERRCRDHRSQRQRWQSIFSWSQTTNKQISFCRLSMPRQHLLQWTQLARPAQEQKPLWKDLRPWDTSWMTWRRLSTLQLGKPAMSLMLSLLLLHLPLLLLSLLLKMSINKRLIWRPEIKMTKPWQKISKDDFFFCTFPPVLIKFYRSRLVP